jgi:putative phosphoesterase
MLIGIIADSHDNVVAIETAVEFLNSNKVDFVIHAGDFIAPFSLAPLEKLRCPWIGVFGNNDGEKRGLTNISKGRIQSAPYAINLDGKRVVVVHDRMDIEDNSTELENTDVLICGHSHEQNIDKMDDNILMINPGELGGWLSGKHTVGLLDTTELKAWIEELTVK